MYERLQLRMRNGECGVPAGHRGAADCTGSHSTAHSPRSVPTMRPVPAPASSHRFATYFHFHFQLK